MMNPYEQKTPAQFWRSAVADLPRAQVAPVRAKRFRIAEGAAIATAGSCFAQNVARYIATIPQLRFLQTELPEADQPLFSALYGNVYTVRQLWQLFEEAQGSFHPSSHVWRRDDGAYVDPFRPTMFAAGFAAPAQVAAARAEHLRAVRRVFAECSVFVFTLGLTETWLSADDGAVFPVAPGVVASPSEPSRYGFHNFSYAEVLADLHRFLAGLRSVNPTARVILTVSPVPLTATYTDEHVLVATVHSKSILRAVCAAVDASEPDVFYFPSYEIVSGHYSRGAYFADNLRSVTQAGVDHVMNVFRATYLEAAAPAMPVAASPAAAALAEAPEYAFEPDAEVICDEEEIVKSIGF